MTGSRCCEQRKQATNVLVVVLPRVLFLKFPQKAETIAKVQVLFEFGAISRFPYEGWTKEKGTQGSASDSAKCYNELRWAG